MKNSDKIIHDIKTAGFIVGTSLTLSACNWSGKSESGQQDYFEVSRKTDSVLQKDSMFSFSLSVHDFSTREINKCHDMNIQIVKDCTEKYVRRNISDKSLYNFMLLTLQNDAYVLSCTGDYEDNCDNQTPDIKYISKIRRNYRWFNDVMMYLSGQYDDAQFLKTGFFKLIDDKRALKAFNDNLKSIQDCQNMAKISNSRLVSKHTQIWDKYVEEQKKLKQR